MDDMRYVRWWWWRRNHENEGDVKGVREQRGKIKLYSAFALITFISFPFSFLPLPFFSFLFLPPNSSRKCRLSEANQMLKCLYPYPVLHLSIWNNRKVSLLFYFFYIWCLFQSIFFNLLLLFYFYLYKIELFVNLQHTKKVVSSSFL